MKTLEKANATSFAINLTDFLGLVAVWECQDGYWKLLTITRLTSAILLCGKLSETRLIFSTSVNPNRVLPKQIVSLNTNPILLKNKNYQRILYQVEMFPGSTLFSLSEKLNIGVVACRRYLQQLQFLKEIYSCGSAVDNTKVYYLLFKDRHQTSDTKVASKNITNISNLNQQTYRTS